MASNRLQSCNDAFHGEGACALAAGSMSGWRLVVTFYAPCPLRIVAAANENPAVGGSKGLRIEDHWMPCEIDALFLTVDDSL